MILRCNFCEKLVEAETLYQYEDKKQTDLPTTFILTKCSGCDLPLLACSHDYGDGWGPPFRIHPPDEHQISNYIPMEIRKAYEEAILCLENKAFTASAIMCRKTLEGVCKSHGATARNLVSGLKELKDKGIIESRLFEWAEELRSFGNEAAHDIHVTIDPVDARDILEFTQALLEYLFTYRQKFEAYKDRRVKAAKRKTKKSKKVSYPKDDDIPF